MRFQLVQKNEYGQTSIVGTSEDIAAMVKLARQKVTEDNMENALTMDNKLMEWESYFVEVIDEQGNPTTEVVYGGMERMGHIVFKFGNGQAKKITLGDVNVPVKLFIGMDNKTAYYASVPSKKRVGQYDEIADILDRNLVDKTAYYINVIK